MMISLSTSGSLGHAIDKYNAMKNVYLLQTELIGITNRERKPPLKDLGRCCPQHLKLCPRKESMSSYISQGTPVAVAKT